MAVVVSDSLVYYYKYFINICFSGDPGAGPVHGVHPPPPQGPHHPPQQHHGPPPPQQHNGGGPPGSNIDLGAVYQQTVENRVTKYVNISDLLIEFHL